MRVWILTAVLFFSLSVLPAEPLHFSSNSMGMTLEKISPFRLDEFEYVLSVEENGQIELRILYREGEEIKRWEKKTLPDVVQEDYYAEGERESAALYTIRGDLLEEQEYAEGNLDWKRIFVYENSLLTEILEFDGEGNLLSTSRFIRSSSGRMQRVIRTSESGEENISSYVYSSRGIAEEWHGTSVKGDLFRFNPKGDTTAEEVWEGNNLKSHRLYTYEQEGGYRVEEEDFETGKVSRQLYDQEDNLRREFTTDRGNLVEDILYTYEDGLLTEKARKLPGLKERWTYAYDGDDEVVKEEYFKNGKLTKVTEYTGENTYFEDIYRGGEPFLRVFFEDETKVKEEYIKVQ